MEFKMVSLRLSGGQELRVRQAGLQDLEKLADFFSRLPSDVVQSFKYDVRDHQILTHRLRQMDDQSHWRLVAEVGEKIVASATLDRDAFGWTKHIGDLRVIVDDEYEKLGVRAVLCEQFVAIAQAAGIERVQTEVLVERTDLFPILERLGFARELVRKGYAKGSDGKRHDVAIMTNEVDRMWRILEESMKDADSNYTRWFSGSC